MGEGIGSINPKEQSLRSKAFGQLFNQELVSLSLEERKQVAQSYIDRFSNTKATKELLKEASLENIDPRHIENAILLRRDPLVYELTTRINYCQHLLEEEKDVLSYSILRLEGNMSPESVSTITLHKDEQLRVIQHPFYFNAKANLIKQYGEEESRILVTAQQAMNRANSRIGQRIIGQRHTVPELTTIGVLYFQSSTKT